MYIKVKKVYVKSWKRENQGKLSLGKYRSSKKENSKFNFYGLKTLIIQFSREYWNIKIKYSDFSFPLLPGDGSRLHIVYYCC